MSDREDRHMSEGGGGTLGCKRVPCSFYFCLLYWEHLEICDRHLQSQEFVHPLLCIPSYAPRTFRTFFFFFCFMFPSWSLDRWQSNTKLNGSTEGRETLSPWKHISPHVKREAHKYTSWSWFLVFRLAVIAPLNLDCSPFLPLCLGFRCVPKGLLPLQDSPPHRAY